VRDPYKMTDKITVLCILTFTFLEGRQENKTTLKKRQQAFPWSSCFSYFITFCS
jgi:hypothetical protein